MNPLQQTIETYKQTLLDLATEPGTETHQQGLHAAQQLLKNPYLSHPLKQGLESKLLLLEQQKSEPAYEPQPNDVYQHWKGNKYRIVGVAIDPDGQKFVIYLPDHLTDDVKQVWLFYPACIAKHSDTNAIMLVSRSESGEISIELTKMPEETIALVWAHPLDDFLTVLGDTGEADGGTMFYRFQLISHAHHP